MGDRQPINGMSHVVGLDDTALLETTIPEMLARAVTAHANLEAAVFAQEGVRWSYAEFARQVDRFAGGLHALGVAKGDRVGIWSPNHSAWLVTQFATARIGAILVCVNPAYRSYELEYALNKSGCSTLVTAQSFKTSDYIQTLNDLAPELASAAPGALSAAKLPALKRVIAIGDATPPGMLGFDVVSAMGDAVDTADLDAISNGLSNTDPINIQFTSGTTGNPKGACLTHRNIVNNADAVTAAMCMTAADRLCIPVPFYHCFGMVMGVLGCISHGACMVFPDEAFDATSVLKTVEAEKCTALYGVPTMFIGELDHPDFNKFDLSSLRTGTMAGSPCPIEVMKRVIGEMNMEEVTIAYGMTETSPVSFQSKPADSIEKRVSTVGQIHPFVEVKIIDEEGETLPRDRQGELCTRGYSVMLGYWDDQEKTAEAIDEAGWMHTGDLATMDDQGYVNITGRVKDMIIRGGENVYPREIEEYLYRHEAIQDVQVFGIPDAKYGEEIACWIIPRAEQSLDAEGIIAFCKDQIAHYKVPRHIRIVDEFPMTVTGKIQKFVMRDQMIKELGIETLKTA